MVSVPTPCQNPRRRCALASLPWLLLPSVLVAAPPASGDVLIDFEDLTGGVSVTNQYAEVIHFQYATCVDYSQTVPPLPGFAHSGTKAIEACYASEGCRVPVQMDFTPPNHRVSILVGYRAPLPTSATVVLTAYDDSGAEIAFATATLGPSPDPHRINSHLEVLSAAGLIARATVGILEAQDPSPTASNTWLAIDDVFFHREGTSPPAMKVEVTQAIQDLDNSVPLFIGKRTLARAYVDAGSAVSGSLTASIYDRDDLTTPVWGPLTIGPVTLPAAVHRERFNETINFEIPAFGPPNPGVPFLLKWLAGHEYQLVTSFQPSGGGAPISTQNQLVFYDSVPLVIMPWWILYPDGSRVSAATFGRVIRRLGALYPIGRVMVVDRGLSLRRDQDWILALRTSFALLSGVDAAAIELGFEPPGCTTCFWTAPRLDPVQPGVIGTGYLNQRFSTALLPANDINGGAGVQAHEIGHNLTRKHADHGGDPLYLDLSFPFPHGAISDGGTSRYLSNVTSQGRHNGGDPGTNPAHPGQSWWIIPGQGGFFHHDDFMTASVGFTDIWTSPYTYLALSCENRKGKFDSWYSDAAAFPPGALAPTSVCDNSTSEAGPLAVLRAGGALGANATATSWTRAAVVGGTIQAGGGITFGSGNVFDMPESPELTAPGTGEFSVRLLDGSGKVLGQKAFGRDPDSGDDFTFAETLPWNQLTASIVVVDEAHGGVELGRVTRRAGLPSGSFTSLPHGSFAQPKQIRWNLRHADGDGGMSCMLMFSPNAGKTWHFVASDLTQSSYLLDPATLPGAGNGQLRLVVSDGMQTAIVDGPADLVVAPKPPRIAIVEPSDGERVTAGARLALRAYGTSPQSGVLGDAAFAWYTGNRLLAQGTDIEVTGLAAGRQVIRLVVTDAQKLTAEARVAVDLDPASVAVLGDAPGTTIPSISPANAGPPVIAVHADPDVLWPPNHKLAEVVATVTVSDLVDPNPQFVLTSITSSEPDHGAGDNTVGDIQGAEIGTADTRFQLRSERGQGDRFYVACYLATNAAGLTAEACDTVFVPHDQSGLATLDVTDGNGRLTIFGAAAAPVRGIVTESVELGGDDFTRFHADATDPVYGDQNGDGVEDARFSFLGSADRLRASMGSGTELFARWSGPSGTSLASIPSSGTVGVSGSKAPAELQVSVSPNPLRRLATIRYSLPRAGHVRLAVYDLAGREVALLVDGQVPAGEHEVRWSGSGIAGVAQVYYYRLGALGRTLTGKFVMLR